MERLTIKQHCWLSVRAATLPLVYLSLYLILIAVWHLAGWPDPDHFANRVQDLFRRDGLPIVLIAALGEGFVLFNLYFPGSIVILLGMAVSRGNPHLAAATIAAVTCGFVISAQVNFSIGRYGFYPVLLRLGGAKALDRANLQFRRYGLYALGGSHFHPDLGGFIDVACGIAKMRWSRFFVVSFTATACWNILWGVVAYFAAGELISAATQPAIPLVVLTAWSILSIGRAIWRGKPS